MKIAKYTVEDFILDEKFKTWIYSPSKASNAYWSKVFEEYPSQINNALIAKEVLLNLGMSGYDLSDQESKDLWQKIDREIERFNFQDSLKIKSLHVSTEKNKKEENRRIKSGVKVAAIVVIAVFLSFLASHFIGQKNFTEVVENLPQKEFRKVTTPPGVKSTLTMSDGTKVFINSGSSIRFLNTFEANKREVFLEGEAYFEVAKDSLRPFSVITGSITTRALGTSFNISAYPSELVNVALVEGQVEVDPHLEDTNSVFLQKGELASFNHQSGTIKKQQFDSELVLAWTNKKIIFQGVHLPEALRILENWFGVKFLIDSKPSQEIILHGVFQDETLENILENLSYTAGFNYKINKDEVRLIFN